MAKEINKVNKENETEQTEHPYPELFQEKERLMKDRMNAHEELVYQELVKKFINNK